MAKTNEESCERESHMRADCAATFATLQNETKHIRSATDDIKNQISELKVLIVGEELNGGLVGQHRHLQDRVSRHATYWSIFLFFISTLIVSGIGAFMYFMARQ